MHPTSLDELKRREVVKKYPNAADFGSILVADHERYEVIDMLSQLNDLEDYGIDCLSLFNDMIIAKRNKEIEDVWLYCLEIGSWDPERDERFLEQLLKNLLRMMLKTAPGSSS